MKSFCSLLIALFAVVVLAAVAVAKPPFWDDQINDPGRFKKLSEFDNEAVLDRETGLVWEQSPNTVARTWVVALSHCYTQFTGGRRGWRVPTIEELASLVYPHDDFPVPGWHLPPGHPFENVQLAYYWSATTSADLSTSAWIVRLDFGLVSTADKANNRFAWCVRGGQGIDGVQ